MDTMNSPLVSVCVMTYNSSPYIIETLNSIKYQIYSNLELIITDDSSKDDTLKIVRAWVNENSSHFINVVIVDSPINTGVAANLNRGVKASKGEWIKTIAGDDLLRNDAISVFVDFINSNPGCRACVCKLKCFGKDESYRQEVQNCVDDLWNIAKRTFDNNTQYKESLRQHFISGPGVFYQASLIKEIGYFDERFPFCEEFPFENKVLSVTAIHPIDEYLVYYRTSDYSLSGKENKFSIAYKSYSDYFWLERRKLLKDNGLQIDYIKQTLEFYGKDLEYKNKWYAGIYSIILNSVVKIIKLFC